MANPVARLGPVQRENSGSDFNFVFQIPSSARNGVFNLAPSLVRRTYASQYAPVPIALSDHAPREFRANNATDISIEFEIVGLSSQDDVEPSLKKLRGFMRKDRRTGEPPDLIFAMGTKVWTVRIDRMEHTPKLWNPDTGEQRVHVTIQMHTQEWEK